MRKKVIELFDFSKSSKTTTLLFLEIILGSGTTLLCLLLFFKLAQDVVAKEVFSFDATITHFIYSFRSEIMTQIMRSITFLGGDIFLLVGIIVTIFLIWQKHKKDAFVFSFTLFFGIGLNLLLKAVFQRPRPHLLPLIHETSYSFPSGHAMNSFVFYACLAYFIFLNGKNKKLGAILSILSGIIVLLIGVSRIYLGVHYPSDIIAGYVAGLCWFVVVLLVEKTIIFSRMFKKYELEKKY